MTGRTEAGDKYGYVGELIDPDWTPEPEAVVADHIRPPRLGNQPFFPEPGIYFGMDENDYHAVPAASSSGLKKLGVSSMDYWANSWMNPDREEVQKDYFDLGKAIHAFVLEGEAAYIDRFVVDLDPGEFKDKPVLVSTEEIKAAIGRFTEIAPVKPQGSKKQELIDQLAELGAKHDQSVDLDGTAADLRERIKAFSEERAVQPVPKVEDIGPDEEPYMRAATKGDWIAQLLALDPDALVWDDMRAKHLAPHEGKTVIDPRTDRRIRIAVKMIQGHEEISHAFTGGHAEVSVFWYCPKTGVPCKARFDYLKMNALVDLKSFGNNAGMPIDRAIERTIAAYRYNLQHAFYVEAAMAAKAMIREQGPDCICQPVETYDKDVIDWCKHWSKIENEPGFLFVFQQTGAAPVTRGKIMPTGTVYSVTRSRIEELKRKWADCAATFGTDPWLDIKPIDEIEDEAIPLYATEL